MKSIFGEKTFPSFKRVSIPKVEDEKHAGGCRAPCRKKFKRRHRAEVFAVTDTLTILTLCYVKIYVFTTT